MYSGCVCVSLSCYNKANIAWHICQCLQKSPNDVPVFYCSHMLCNCPPSSEEKHVLSNCFVQTDWGRTIRGSVCLRILSTCSAGRRRPRKAVSMAPAMLPVITEVQKTPSDIIPCRSSWASMKNPWALNGFPGPLEKGHGDMDIWISRAWTALGGFLAASVCSLFANIVVSRWLGESHSCCCLWAFFFFLV